MKKLHFIVFILLSHYLIIFLPINTAYAVNDEFLRVITYDTPFYSNIDDKDPLFYLPYTYYVKAIKQVGEFLHVEIHCSNQPIIDGFVPLELLFYDQLEVINPYPQISITTKTTTILYADSDLSSSIQYVFEGKELVFYGSIIFSGENLLFVGYNDKLGYVKEQDVMPFSIPNHPNPLTFITEIDKENPPEQEDFFSIKIIIIVCLLFAGLTALFVALGVKRENNNAVSEYYDENDYR